MTDAMANVSYSPSALLGVKKKLIWLAVFLFVLVGAPLMTASPAQAAGKTTIGSCYSGQTNTAQNQMSIICNTAGTHYQFQIKCQWGTKTAWRSSSWTADRKRAYAYCGSGRMIAVGKTVYHQTLNAN